MVYENYAVPHLYEYYLCVEANKRVVITTCTNYDTDFDVLVTTNEENYKKIIDQKTNVVVFLLGISIPNEPTYILILPDSLGIEDEYGRLNTHLSLSICIKIDGNCLDGIGVTNFLRSHGVHNRTVFTVCQLQQLSRKLKRYYVDFGGVLQEELSSLLVSEYTNVFVEKVAYKQRMEKHIQDSKKGQSKS